MTRLLQISINLSNFNTTHGELPQTNSFPSLNLSRSFNRYHLSKTTFCSFHQNEQRITSCPWRYQLLGLMDISKKGFLVEKNDKTIKRRMVVVNFNKRPGLNGGGGGGFDGNSARVLGNLALAAGLTYLSVTGQLGWVLDAIVSVWLLVVILPIVGLGVFFWWAGRDIVEGTFVPCDLNKKFTDMQCPNCGNDFQVFKSSLGDDLQFCPFCSQPFSVVDNKFVADPVKFYNQPNSFDQAFTGLSNFSRSSKKGKDKSKAIVDVEAEVKDAD